MAKSKQLELQGNELVLLVKPRFQTQWNKAAFPGKKNPKPSLTAPDQSMTILEFIEKFASGDRMHNYGKQMFYDGIGHGTVIEDDVLLGKNWDSLDIVEKHEILAHAKNDFSDIKKGIALAQKEKAEQLAQERRNEAEQKKQFQEWLAKKDAGAS